MMRSSMNFTVGLRSAAVAGCPRSAQWDEWLGGWDVQRVPRVAFGG